MARLNDQATQPEEPAIANPQRFHGFDALRGGAMLLGVVQHAGMAYMTRPMDGLLWPLRANTVEGGTQPGHTFFDLMLWWVHCWRVPMFFVIGGFFAAMLVRRRGANGYMHHRYKRLIIPIIAASATFLTAMYFIWSWGWIYEGRAEWREVWRTSFDDDVIDDKMLSTGHLWFLYYLAVFAVVYWGLLKLRGKAEPGDIPPGRWVQAVFGSGWAPLVLALPTIGAIFIFPHFFLAHDHNLVPRNLYKSGIEILQIAYQGYYFIVGVYLFRMHRQMQRVARWTWGYLVAASLLFVVAMMFAQQWFDYLDHGKVFGFATRLALAASLSLFCWCMIWGMLGLGLGVLSKARGWVRWLSDSAYWVYLLHLPVVGIMMMLVRDWTDSPFLKYLVVMSVTAAITLITYQTLVRYTFIGIMLHGPRQRSDQLANAKTPRRQDAKATDRSIPAWSVIKERFEKNNGSLPEILIKPVDTHDWARFLNWVGDLPNRTEYFHGPQKIDKQIKTLKALEQMQYTDPVLIKIWVKESIQLNLHFFTPVEIELDLDPKEINSHADYQAVITFLTKLSDHLGKRVILTEENSEDDVILAI